MKETFITFIQSFNNIDPILVESIKNGFNVCFESDQPVKKVLNIPNKSPDVIFLNAGKKSRTDKSPLIIGYFPYEFIPSGAYVGGVYFFDGEPHKLSNYGSNEVDLTGETVFYLDAIRSRRPKLATIEEYNPLLNELKELGYSPTVLSQPDYKKHIQMLDELKKAGYFTW